MNTDVDTVTPSRRRNRFWPEALKREIVAASFEAGASVSVVARRYDVNTNQVFAWRKLYSTDEGASADPSGPMLLPVTVMAEAEMAGASTSSASDTVEIEFIGTARIRVPATTPPALAAATLAQVLTG